jgi:hypothetical protein
MLVFRNDYEVNGKPDFNMKGLAEIIIYPSS